MRNWWVSCECAVYLSAWCHGRLQALDGKEPNEITEGTGHYEWADSMEHLACHSIFRILGTRLSSDVMCDPRNGLQRRVTRTLVRCRPVDVRSKRTTSSRSSTPKASRTRCFICSISTRTSLALLVPSLRMTLAC